MKELDRLCRKLADDGVEFLQAPKIMLWGWKHAYLKDLDGQKLILTHMSTQEEQSCHVVYIGKERDRKTEVGVGFTHAAPRFWRIAFPPEDWKKV